MKKIKRMLLELFDCRKHTLVTVDEYCIDEGLFMLSVYFE